MKIQTGNLEIVRGEVTPYQFGPATAQNFVGKIDLPHIIGDEETIYCNTESQPGQKDQSADIENGAKVYPVENAVDTLRRLRIEISSEYLLEYRGDHLCNTRPKETH